MEFAIPEEIEKEVKKLSLVAKKKIVYPTRKRSLVIKPRVIQYRTKDKTVCRDCICFKQEAPYVSPAKLRKCLKTPLTLYELAAAVVDAMPLPPAFSWSVQDVADWMCNDVGLPQYRECITKNQIDGYRLIVLEDPSRLPDMNIHYFCDIKMITSKVRKLYGLDYIRFARSIGLPPRRPSVHAVQFKARTRPFGSERGAWTTSDLLRWMKILNPKPVVINHWDFVRYEKPELPKTLFGRVPPVQNRDKIPIYREKEDKNKRIEYQVPRRFCVCPDYTDQLIWMEKKSEESEPKPISSKKVKLPKPSRLDRKPIDLSQCHGVQYILAKRLMPKKRYFL